MKIDIRKISAEGLLLHEELNPVALDLETEIIKFRRPIFVSGRVEKITNAVSVNLALDILISAICSRCLDEFQVNPKKNLKLFYPADKLDIVIDLNPDIREEIILEYPLKPLCKPDCKGLCPKCAEKLNGAGCKCNVDK